MCSRNSRTFGSVLIISIVNNGLNQLGVSSFYALVDPTVKRHLTRKEREPIDGFRLYAGERTFMATR
jgi:hypothetical protein